MKLEGPPNQVNSGGSAGFHPAVSQGFQPAGLPQAWDARLSVILPIGNQRPAPKAFGVHRFETCATSIVSPCLRSPADPQTSAAPKTPQIGCAATQTSPAQTWPHRPA